MAHSHEHYVGYEGKRRFVLEETFAAGRRLFFFDSTGNQLVDVVNAVEHYNRHDVYVKRGCDGSAKLYIAAEFLRVYGCTAAEEEEFMARSLQRDDGLEIQMCTAAQAAAALEEK